MAASMNSRPLPLLAMLALSAATLPLSARVPDQPAAEPGVDMILIDPEAMPAEPERAVDAPEAEDISWTGAPVDLLKPLHPRYTELRRQLIRYQRDWSALPQVRVPDRGGPLSERSTNPRVRALRERLGLVPDGPADAALASRVAEFQRVHGLPVDGKPGPRTLAAMNRGALHFERVLLLNMERARRLPAPGAVKRYILVDSASARLWMMEDDRAVDSMKVVVGGPKSPTPMMAAQMRFANVNPYWNVPSDLVASLIAPRVLAQGPAYLAERRYEVLESWDKDAGVIDPMSVDWQAIADGGTEQRVRQLPGGANSMGAIKFMMPNEYGIYLHDTPNKDLFGSEERWVSNGCVRLEDAARLARWIFGAVPRPTDPDKEDFLELYQPLPVYLTYLTVGDDGGGPRFLADPYGRDAKVLTRFADDPATLKEARPALKIDFAPTKDPLAPNATATATTTKPAITPKKPAAAAGKAVAPVKKRKPVAKPPLLRSKAVGAQKVKRTPPT